MNSDDKVKMGVEVVKDLLKREDDPIININNALWPKVREHLTEDEVRRVEANAGTTNSPAWGSIKKTEENGYKPSDFIIVGENVSSSKLPYKYKGKIHCGGVRAALAAVGGARSGEKMSLSPAQRSKLMNAAKQCGISENCDCEISNPAIEEEIANELQEVSSMSEENTNTTEDTPLDEGNGVCPACGTHGPVGEKCVADGSVNVAQADADFSTPQDALSPATNEGEATPETPTEEAPPATPEEPAEAEATQPEPASEPEDNSELIKMKEEMDEMKKQLEETKNALEESRQQNVKETLEQGGYDTEDINLEEMSLNEAKALVKYKDLMKPRESETNGIPRKATSNESTEENEIPISEEQKKYMLNKSPGKFVGKDDSGKPIWENPMEER